VCGPVPALHACLAHIGAVLEEYPGVMPPSPSLPPLGRRYTQAEIDELYATAEGACGSPHLLSCVLWTQAPKQPSIDVAADALAAVVRSIPACSGSAPLVLAVAAPELPKRLPAEVTAFFCLPAAAVGQMQGQFDEYGDPVLLSAPVLPREVNSQLLCDCAPSIVAGHAFVADTVIRIRASRLGPGAALLYASGTAPSPRAIEFAAVALRGAVFGSDAAILASVFSTDAAEAQQVATAARAVGALPSIFAAASPVATTDADGLPVGGLTTVVLLTSFSVAE
jgi:hypothetical protein